MINPKLFIFRYTDSKQKLMANFNNPRLTAPELFASGNDAEIHRQVWWEVSLK